MDRKTGLYIHFPFCVKKCNYCAFLSFNADESVRRAVVHVLGDTGGKVSNGVETFMARYLYGFEKSIPERVRDYTSGTVRKGDTLVLTIDSALSARIAALAEESLSGLQDGLRGAVVVMNWKTGAVLCELSFPLFDPNGQTKGQATGQPYFNRAVQGLYAPGSTFKTVTAAALLEDSTLKDHIFHCSGLYLPPDEPSRTISDAGTVSAEGTIVAHGDIELKRAFRLSCNNTFATAATLLTDRRLRACAERFGFNENFLFSDIVVENSSYPTTDRSSWEVAMTGIGQSGLLATPMHLCLIASAIANGGVMMEPRLIDRVLTPSGALRSERTPRAARTVSTDKTAIGILKDHMFGAVNASDATGRAAQVQGRRVCGKTGSAEVDGQDRTNALFIGFIDDESAPYALSIVLENAGGGGENAAPLAGKIFKALIDQK